MESNGEVEDRFRESLGECPVDGDDGGRPVAELPPRTRNRDLAWPQIRRFGKLEQNHRPATAVMPAVRPRVRPMDVS